MMTRYLGYDFDVYTADTFPYDKVSDNLAPIRGKGIHPTKAGRYYSARVCAFDIETTLIGDDTRTALYHWQFSFDNEYYCTGRTWDEFQAFIKRFASAACDCMMTICVHNLAYEFFYMTPFINETFPDGDIEALMMNNNAPLFYRVNNLKFVDTLRMSGTSLDKMCNDYDLYYRKATGELDYKKRFNTKTVLTEQEKGYCLLDVASLVEWYHKIEELRGYKPHNMPPTKTAFIRTPLRKVMKPQKRDYYDGKVDSYEVFQMLREMFQGGLTCINPTRRNDTVYGDIRCKDFTSSYPAVMCGDIYYYPVTAYTKYDDTLNLDDDNDIDDFMDILENRCCMFRVRFWGLTLKPNFPTGIIASSKCITSDDCAKMNGKVEMAEWVQKVCNEVEFADIVAHYDYNYIEVFDIYTAQRGKLPNDMRRYILELFKQKTQLKFVEGKELDLMLCKADLNAVYGMCAMSPLRSEFTYNPISNETTPKELSEDDMRKAYDKAVNKANAFLHYRYGCYVTTWARHNIILAMGAICEVDPHLYLYTDTDSVYYISTPEVEGKLLELDAYFTDGQISVENETNGKIDTLGRLCPDGEYKAFRGLGAKKYCLLKKDDTIKLTCAGVPKKKGGQMLKSIDQFRTGFVFSGKYTNKLTPVRNVEPIHIEDVNGVMTRTASNIYMRETDYILSESVFDDIINSQFDLWV